MTKTQGRYVLKGIQVREENGRAYLDVQHLDGKISFFAQANGPNTYVNVAQALDEANLEQPTMAQNVSLVYSAWEVPEEQYSREIINILNSSRLWGFNGILSSPKSKGAFIQDRPSIKNGKIIMDESELESKLGSNEENRVVYSNDKTIRFVPFGYKLGAQKASELEKNPFVIALAGEEGAEKLAKVSKNYRYRSCVFNFNEVSEPLIRVSSLGSVGGYVGGLGLVGYLGDGRVGCASGVFKNGQSPRENFSEQMKEEEIPIDKSELLKIYNQLGRLLGKQ